MKALANSTAVAVLDHIRDGRFQISMCLVAGASSFISGLEVGYEHYRGGYGNPVMYTPVILSGVLTLTSVSAIFSEKAARGFLRGTSLLTLADGVIGFGFHIRGIARKPGGWRLPLTNIIMGPPIFAPLLFGTAAYLGFMASYLRRENERPDRLPEEQLTGWRRELQLGRFQKHLLLVSFLWAAFSGFEAWYSHYKNGFRYWAQWTPVVLAPLQMAACLAGLLNERAAKTIVPVSSAAAVLDGLAGFGYHARGILRRTGGMKKWVYNIMYGPPVFAPLLFAACGTLGLLACLLRRERS